MSENKYNLDKVLEELENNVSRFPPTVVVESSLTKGKEMGNIAILMNEHILRSADGPRACKKCSCPKFEAKRTNNGSCTCGHVRGVHH